MTPKDPAKPPAPPSDSARPPRPRRGRPRKGEIRPPAPPRKSTETPGGLVQTSIYLYPDEREALYRRANEETIKRGVRVSIGEIMRTALREFLKLD